MATSSTNNSLQQGYGAQGSPIFQAFPSPVIATRDPTSSDINYVIGREWINKSTPSLWFLGAKASGSATWIAAGSGATGGVVTLTGNSGGSISPVAGNIDVLGGSGVNVVGTAGTLTISLTGGGTAIDSFVPDAGTNPVVPTALGAVTMAGTANQITTTGGLNSLTFSLPAAITAPGSLTTTTSLSATTTVTAGTGITATTGNIQASGGDILATRSSAGADVTLEATNSDNTNAASRAGVEIATGGASSGDPYLSFQISGVGASTMTMGLDNSASDIFVISNSGSIGTSNALTLTQAGALNATTSITAGTSMTATAGDITATLGHIIVNGAAKQFRCHGGAATDFIGQATLVNGVATVLNTNIAATDRVFVTRTAKNASTAYGTFQVVVTAATNFVITSCKSDTTTETNDQSTVDYIIIRQV